MPANGTAEGERLREDAERRAHWKRWGPYVSERAWGTVREDYSAQGDAWHYFPHDHARSRAYRWNEDGLAGICDNHQFLCFAMALWNGRDPFLKERLFGLTGPQGNHGEDVKEDYFYLDSTPTHSYMKWLYKYPQAEFPYARLREENLRRGRDVPEFELLETGVFDGDRYFDVFVEYAKASVEDILIRITVENRGPDPAEIDVLPTIWFRNRWSWRPGLTRPSASRGDEAPAMRTVVLDEEELGRRYLYCDGAPELLFTNNETNADRLFNTANAAPYVKDGIHEYVVDGNAAAVNPAETGTKCAARYRAEIPGGGRAVFHLRLTDALIAAPFAPPFAELFDQRIAEADEFYDGVIPPSLSDDGRRVMRIFLQRDGRRAVNGRNERFQTDPHWRDLVLFHEYFHGDTGEGLGASHQTGWTAIVAKLLQQSGEPQGEQP